MIATAFDPASGSILVDAREAAALRELLVGLGVPCGELAADPERPEARRLPMPTAADPAETRRIGELVAVYNQMRKSRVAFEADDGPG